MVIEKDEGDGEIAKNCTIISPYERVAVLVLQLAVRVLFGLLERDVHVAVETGENPYKHTDKQHSSDLDGG